MAKSNNKSIKEKDMKEIKKCPEPTRKSNRQRVTKKPGYDAAVAGKVGRRCKTKTSEEPMSKSDADEMRAQLPPLKELTKEEVLEIQLEAHNENTKNVHRCWREWDVSFDTNILASRDSLGLSPTDKEIWNLAVDILISLRNSHNYEMRVWKTPDMQLPSYESTNPVTVETLIRRFDAYKTLEEKMLKISRERDRFEESLKKSQEQLEKKLCELEKANGILEQSFQSYKRLQKNMTEVSIGCGLLKESLTITDEKLAKTEAKLAITEHKLEMTRKSLAKAEISLGTTEESLAQTVEELGKLKITAEKLVEAESREAELRRTLEKARSGWDTCEKRLQKAEHNLELTQDLKLKAEANQSSLGKQIEDMKDEKYKLEKELDASNSENVILQRKLRRYSAKRHYDCQLCGSYFTEKTFLDRHVRDDHQKKDFECDHCGTRFMNKNAHEKHVRKCSASQRKQDETTNSSSPDIIILS